MRLLLAIMLTLSFGWSARAELSCPAIIKKLDPNYLRKYIARCAYKKVKPCQSDFCAHQELLNCFELTYKMQLKYFKQARKKHCFEPIH